MPELPEVETVRRGLHEHLLGAVFTGAEVWRERSNRGQEGNLAELLVGQRIVATHRRGKYLWLELGNGRALFIHLGMSGQVLLRTPGGQPARHTRIRALATTPAGRGVEVCFVDQRTFGRWLVTDCQDGVPLPVRHVARDPLDPAFDAAACARRIRAKRSEIKRVLLDQMVVSGIGNIYADEALWQARIKPTRRAASARQRDVVSLLGEVQAVFRRALAAGGTSFDALYVNVSGSPGYFARSLAVYGREGEACPRCGGPIRRDAWTNRSTHWCPRCQVL